MPQSHYYHKNCFQSQPGERIVFNNKNQSLAKIFKFLWKTLPARWNFVEIALDSVYYPD